MVKKQRFFCIFLIILGFLPQLVHAAQVRVVPDRNRIGFGESLTLELRIEGDVDGDPDLSPLKKDWEILGQSQNSQVQIINGSYNKSLQYILSLMPKREGTLTLPPICCGSVCSEARTVQVSPVETEPSDKEGAELMLEAGIEPVEAVSQQQLVLKIRLLRRIALLQGSLSEPQPAGVEAVVRKLGKDSRYETRRNGYLYQVIERNYAIFPQAGGKLQIPPIRFDGQIRRGSTRFDPFGNQGKRVRRYSEALAVEVKPQPANLHGKAWLPCHALHLEDDWQGQKLQLTVGEPATRTLTATAQGLQAAQLPDMHLAIPESFKSYPDQPTRDEKIGPTGITGILQQKIALVPTRAGHFRLPAMDVDWWDITTKTWRKAHLNAVDLEVAPAPGNAVTAPPQKPVQEKTAPAEATQTANIKEPGFWPWLSLALALGWLVTVVLFWRQRTNKKRLQTAVKTDSRQLREKEARRTVVQNARSNDPKATREALTVWSKTLWPDKKEGGLQLLMKNAPSELQKEMARLNFALFSPEKNSWTGEALIDALKDWRPQKEKKGHSEELPGLYPSVKK